MANNCVKIQALKAPEGLPSWIDKPYYLDLFPDTNLTEVKRLNELTDINQLKISSAYSISIPETKNNKPFISCLLNIHGLSDSQNYIDVNVWRGSTCLNVTELRLISYDPKNCSYSIQLTNRQTHWAKLMKGKSLCDLFDETDTFEVTDQSIQDSWNNWNGSGGIATFPPVWYGNTVRPNTFSTEDFRPLFFLKELIRRAFSCVGWCVDLDGILSCDPFDRTALYLLSDSFNSNANVFEDFYSAWEIDDLLPTNLTTAIWGVQSGEQNTSNQSIGTGQGTVYNSSGNFCICISGQVQSNDNPNFQVTVTFGFIENGVNSPYEVKTFAGASNGLSRVNFCVDDISNLTGRQLYTQINIAGDPDTLFQTNLKLEYKPKSILYGEGSTMTFKDIVDKNCSPLDIVRGFIHMISGKVVTDWSNCCVKILPPKSITIDDKFIEGFYTEERINFSNNQLCDSVTVKIEKSNTKNCNIIGYKKSTDPCITEDPRYTDGDVQFTDGVIKLSGYDPQGSNEQRNPTFEPTITEIFPQYSSPGAQPIRLPVMSDNKDGQISTNIGKRALALTMPFEQFYDPNGFADFIFNGRSIAQIPFGYMSVYRLNINSGGLNPFVDLLLQNNIVYGHSSL